MSRTPRHVRRLQLVALASLAMIFSACSCPLPPVDPAHQVRRASAAGVFYPAEPAALTAEVRRLLKEAPSRGDRRVPIALAPHAAYFFSGHVAAAAKLLGRYYSVKSEVVIGKQLGRALGFPTVNQLISKESTPLKNGVYRTRTRIGHLIKPSITNVGVRPTVDGHTLCAETNVFDFDGDLYGRNIRVEFLEFIRPEKKFDSVEQLSKQVQKDIEKAKNAK